MGRHFISIDDGYDKNGNPRTALACHLAYAAKTQIIQDPQEENVLFYRYTVEGDSEAYERLVESKLRLVVSMALKRRDCGVPLEDLISSGNEGLLRAVETFKPEKGIFFVHARIWIRNYIKAEIHSNSSTIRIPADVLETKNKLCRILDRVADETLSLEDLVGIFYADYLSGRNKYGGPTDEAARKRTVPVIQDIRRRVTDALELIESGMDFVPLEAAESRERMEGKISGSPEEELLSRELLDMLDLFLEELPDLDRELVLRHLGGEKPAEVAGKAYAGGLGPDKISRLVWYRINQFKEIVSIRDGSLELKTMESLIGLFKDSVPNTPKGSIWRKYVVNEIGRRMEPRLLAGVSNEDFCRLIVLKSSVAINQYADLWKSMETAKGELARRLEKFVNWKVWKTVDGYRKSNDMSCVDEEDLRQEAWIKIMAMVDRFDPDRGVKFATFIGQAVEWDVRDIIRDLLGVRRKKGAKVVFLEDLLPSGSEGDSEAFDVPDGRPDQLEQLMEMEHSRSMRETLGAARARLPEKERKIISMLYPLEEFAREGEGLTMEEVGDRLNLSESRISQLHAKSLCRLRYALRRSG